VPPVFTTLYEVLSPAGEVLLSSTGDQTQTYETITWRRPGRPKRRLVEQGAYVDAEVETVSVLDVARVQWEVRIKAVSYAALEAAYNALVDAVEAGPGMGFRVTIAGQARTYHCTGSANIDARATGRDGDALRWSFREEYVIDWPCHPTPS
jgi:hypothetical protein